MGGKWKETSFAAVIDVKHGFAFPGENIREEPPGDILLTPGNFAIGGGFKGDKFKYFDGNVPEDYVLSEGDLIVTMTDLSKQADTLGYPAIVPGRRGPRFLHNQRLGKVLIKRDDKLDKIFFFYLLHTAEYRHEVLASATGTTVKHTSPGRILAHKANIPPLAEQKAIARVLGALDNKIELNRRMNATLEAMARALFQSWFVDFDPVRAKLDGRQPANMDPETAVLFPAAFQESALGPIPIGWRVAEIGQIADVIDCLHAKKPERANSGRLYLQLNNIRNDGLIDVSDSFLISGSDYETWISRMEAQQGDCVITNVGRVGAVAQIPIGIEAALGRNMTGIRCKSDFQYPTFLIECLLSDAMREEIRMNMDTGTILDALNVKNIPKLRFTCPSPEVAACFEKAARPLRSKMEQNIVESRTLATLRDTLLPKLLSGELSTDKLREAV